MRKRDLKKYIESRHINRRQFLMGLGGTMLALPPLMSLWSKGLHAQTAGRVKRVILLPTLFGINRRDFFPATPGLNLQTQFAVSDASIFTTPLSQIPNNMSVALGSAFNDPVLRSKMNIYEGLDVTNGNEIVSHTRALLGGFSDYPDPTRGTSIDNIIAKAAGFYPSASANPVLRMASSNKAKHWSFETNSSGSVTRHDFYMGDKDIFNRVFANVGAPPSGSGLSQNDQDKVLIADKTLADFTALKNHRRISTTDKIVLDQHMNYLYELEAKIRANAVPPPTCSAPGITIQVTKTGQYYAFPGDYGGETWGVTSSLAMMRNYNEIIRSAFLCDLTRVVVLGNDIFQDAPMSTYNAESLFHSHDDGTGGPTTTAQKHAWFLNRVAELATLLNNTPDPLSSSGSLLDNSVILFTNEHSGVSAHGSFTIPTLTIGSAGGYFKTGHYIDCRQRPYTETNYHLSRGRPIKQLLISIMESMGVTSSAYLNSSGNFGEFSVNAGANFPGAYSKFSGTHNGPLPFIKI